MAYTFQESWPPVSRNAADILQYVSALSLGLDLEWDIKTGVPTILGVGDGKTAVSVSWEEGKPYLLELLRRRPNIKLVGHNIVGADLMVLEELGIKIDLENTEDTIIRHWLLHMHLSKTTKKSADPDDTEEKRGRGFNNLWTMASLGTSLRNWKYCRGSECSGPCPEHDVFGYNGIDALAPVIAAPKMKRSMQLRGIEHLYPMHRDLAYVLADMSRFGVFVDVPYIQQLREEFIRAKEEVSQELPFNPDSPKQVLDYFHARGIKLENNREQTVRDMCEELGIEGESGVFASPEEQALYGLLEFKELGDGADRWFAPRTWNSKTNEWDGFVDEHGFLHPHIGYYTSSARLQCTGPNLQNVAKRRVDRHKCQCGHPATEHIAEGGQKACIRCECKKFKGESVGKKIRRAIIAPPGHYIVRADLSNAENRVMLYHAGYQVDRKIDLHKWVKELAGLTDDMPFSIAMGNAREAAKSIQHAGNYLEGLQLKLPGELKQSKIQTEIAVGARTVFPDWTFRGKIVTFTGINLARRAFGEASWENRKAALEIAEKYFGRFTQVRDLQKRITKQIEEEKMVRPPHGYCLLSFGDDHDRMKTAAAVWGSQPVAHVTKLALLNLHKHMREGRPMRPVLQVHDEILTYVRDDVPPEQAARWLVDDMEVQTKEMPNFVIPAEPSYGDNWRDQKEVKL